MTGKLWKNVTRANPQQAVGRERERVFLYEPLLQIQCRQTINLEEQETRLKNSIQDATKLLHASHPAVVLKSTRGKNKCLRRVVQAAALNGDLFTVRAGFLFG